MKNIRKENLELNRVNSDNSDTIKDFQQTVENQGRQSKMQLQRQKIRDLSPKYKYKIRC